MLPLPKSTVDILIPESSFGIGAFAEPWELEAESSTSAAGSSVRGSRASVLGRPNRVGGIERRGNVTKVGVLALIGEHARGDIVFDLEVAFTYKAEEEQQLSKGADKDRAGASEAAEAGGVGAALIEVTKTFTYHARVHLGRVE